ncbi:hypothetical protein BH20ACT24_BH20ACT24_03370 [soil metagenome]
MRIRPLLVALSLLLLPAACVGGETVGDSAAMAVRPGPPVLYVALGASETVGIGTDDPVREAWPQLLYRSSMPRSAVFVNLGIPGATVADALERELPQALELRPDIVTVWLNVNDLIAGVPPATYEAGLQRLLTSLRRGGIARVLVANTPPLDRLPAYLACRPGAPVGGPPCLTDRVLPPAERINELTAAYNDVIERVAGEAGAEVVDLHSAGMAARSQESGEVLISEDGFHPSAAGARVVADAFARILSRD